MWYRQKDAVVLTLIVCDDVLFLVLAQKVYKKQYAILSYTSFKSSLYTLNNGIIYNYTVIKGAISSFLKKQKIQPSFLTIIIDNQQVATHFFAAVQPFSDELIENKIMHKQAHHMHYIGPFQDTDHLLYSCSVSQHVLLQYELLGSFFNIPLLCISCWIHPLLYAYRGCKETAFRSSVLTKDMVQYDKNFTDFFTQDMMHRFFYKIPIGEHMYKKAFLMTYGHLVYQEMLHG